VLIDSENNQKSQNRFVREVIEASIRRIGKQEESKQRVALSGD
jgi:hypothetical protein